MFVLFTRLGLLGTAVERFPDRTLDRYVTVRGASWVLEFPRRVAPRQSYAPRLVLELQHRNWHGSEVSEGQSSRGVNTCASPVAMRFQEGSF